MSIKKGINKIIEGLEIIKGSLEEEETKDLNREIKIEEDDFKCLELSKEMEIDLMMLSMERDKIFYGMLGEEEVRKSKEDKIVIENEDRDNLQRFEIWSEGYVITGGRGKAQLLGVEVADTFKNACKRYAMKNPEFKYYFNEDSLTFWGCRLYDNEEDARKGFG